MNIVKEKAKYQEKLKENILVDQAQKKKIEDLFVIVESTFKDLAEIIPSPSMRQMIEILSMDALLIKVKELMLQLPI